MQNHLIKIANFHDFQTAHLIKNYLENNSIFAKLNGEHTNNVLPIIDNTISLLVFENDIQKTLVILKSFQKEYNFTILIETV